MARSQAAARVAADGDPASDLWFIGRDPGTAETLTGKPFVGPAGNVLWNAAYAAGIRRQSTYVDNLVPVQPPRNDFSKHPVALVEQCRKDLLDDIDRHRPKLVVTFGGEAGRAVLGKQWPADRRGKPEGIQNVRGYMWDLPNGVRVLPTVHPAAVLREWVPWRVLLDLDLKKAQRELGDMSPFPAVKVHIVAYDNVKRFFNSLRRRRPDEQLVAVDIENATPALLSCIGFAWKTDEAWVFPNSYESNRLIRERGPFTSIASILEDKTIPKVLQNGQYDRYFLRAAEDIELAGQTFDTMLGWHALQPELAGAAGTGGKRRTHKSLRFLASIFTRYQWWKDYDFAASSNEQFELNGRDCAITLRIAQELQRHLGAT